MWNFILGCGLPEAAAAVEAGLMAAEVGEVERLAAGEAAADQSDVSMGSRDRGSTNHSSPEAVFVEHPGLHLHLLCLEHLAAAPRAAAALEVISQTSAYCLHPEIHPSKKCNKHFAVLLI